MPSLGGMAAIFEISDYGRSPLTARVYTLYGHPRLGWTIEESRSFSLQRVEYLRLVARVDSALTEYRTGAVADPDVIAVCTDGPGLVTERVVQGSVATLGGTCGWTEEGKHPNERILMLVTDLVCRHLGHEAASALRPYDRQLRRRCPG